MCKKVIGAVIFYFILLTILCSIFPNNILLSFFLWIPVGIIGLLFLYGIITGILASKRFKE